MRGEAFAFTKELNYMEKGLKSLFLNLFFFLHENYLELWYTFLSGQSEDL